MRHFNLPKKFAVSLASSSLEYQTSWQDSENKNGKKKSILDITTIACIQGNNKDSEGNSMILATSQNDGTIRYLLFEDVLDTDEGDKDSNENIINSSASNKRGETDDIVHSKQTLMDITDMIVVEVSTSTRNNKPIFAIDSILTNVIHRTSMSQEMEMKSPSLALQPILDCHILSGSFDRSASLHHVPIAVTKDFESFRYKKGVKSTDNEVDENSIDLSVNPATLPEHTGWVRGVKLLHFYSDTDQISMTDDIVVGDESTAACTTTKNRKDFVCLSIGCNLINVWIPAGTTEHTPSLTTSGSTSHRIARLDGGPSPNDTQDFRRHDILCFDVLVNDKSINKYPAVASGDSTGDRINNSIIVAGLVDGTLRAWEGRWNHWLQRLDRNGEYIYDATGSCCNKLATQLSSKKQDVGTDNIESYDDKPVASIEAHQDRVIGIHACQSDNKYLSIISLARNGCWSQWHIVAEEKGGSVRFVLLSTGSIFENDEDDGKEKICSSSTVASLDRSTILYVGTTNGQIYSVTLDKEDETETTVRKELVWCEDEALDRESAASTSIASLHYVRASAPNHPGHTGYLLAGNSIGSVRVFKAPD